MPIIVYTSQQIPIHLEDSPLAEGGEGAVHRIISDSNRCAKIYHPQKRNTFRKRKVEFMIQNKPQILTGASFIICWPIDMIFDKKKNFVGFIMPIAFPNHEKLYALTSLNLPKVPKNLSIDPNWTKFNRTTLIGFEKRLKLCVNIAIAVNEIHSSNKYAFVDLKPDNILITNEGKICITDVDSFQISNNNSVLYHAEVATQEYAPPESINQNPSSSFISEHWDRFSLAICFYEILIGLNPFAGTSDGQYAKFTTVGEKIQNGLFVHGSKKSYISEIPPPHDNFLNLPLTIKSLIINAFEIGHTNPQARPSAEEWGQAILLELSRKTNIKPNSPTQPKQKKISPPPIQAPQKNTLPPRYVNRYPPTTATKTTYSWMWFIIIPFVVFCIYYFNKPKSQIAVRNSSTYQNTPRQQAVISFNNEENETGEISFNNEGWATINVVNNDQPMSLEANQPFLISGDNDKNSQQIPSNYIFTFTLNGRGGKLFVKRDGPGPDGILKLNRVMEPQPEQITSIDTIVNPTAEPNESILAETNNGNQNPGVVEIDSKNFNQINENNTVDNANNSDKNQRPGGELIVPVDNNIQSINYQEAYTAWAKDMKSSNNNADNPEQPRAGQQIGAGSFQGGGAGSYQSNPGTYQNRGGTYQTGRGYNQSNNRYPNGNGYTVVQRNIYNPPSYNQYSNSNRSVTSDQNRAVTSDQVGSNAYVPNSAFYITENKEYRFNVNGNVTVSDYIIATLLNGTVINGNLIIGNQANVVNEGVINGNVYINRNASFENKGTVTGQIIRN